MVWSPTVVNGLAGRNFFHRYNMFWIILLILTGLAGFAFGWITIQSSRERFTISLEKEKVRPTLEKLRCAVAGMLTRGRQLFEHSRHS